MKDGGWIVIGIILFAAYLLGNQTPDVYESLQPTPTSKESLQVPPVKESLTAQPSGISEELNHIPDVTKMVDGHEIDFMTIDPQPSPSDKKPAKEIVIFTAKNCPPCDKWKRCEQPKFEAAGWKVAYCEKHDFPLTPTFLIESDGKTKEKRGYFSFEQLGEVLK